MDWNDPGEPDWDSMPKVSDDDDKFELSPFLNPYQKELKRKAEATEIAAAKTRVVKKAIKRKTLPLHHFPSRRITILIGQVP